MPKSERDERTAKVNRAEIAIDNAFSTGKADRAQITRMAQLDAAEAVARAGEAMEADEAADEAMRLTVITEQSGSREKIRAARQRERAARKNANQLHAAATKSARQAYDAIKFSAPNKMGFMRAVQIGFAAHIAFTLIFLLLTHRDNFNVNVGSIMDWVMIVLEGVAFWMFVNRYKVARPFTIATAAVGLLVPAGADMVMGTFSLPMFLVNGMFYIFILFYFSLSRRVKATLVNDLARHKGFYDDGVSVERRGWPFIRNLGIYFVVFSILGHWMEMAMCQLIIAGLVQGEYDPTNTMLWRDWLYPFPMEGMAVVIIALVLYPLYIWMKRKFEGKVAIAYVLSFLANALTCSVIEFSMGLMVNANHQLWDYSDMFGNVMGQVCLQNTLAFGVAASIIAWFVYPMLERMIARVPRDIMNIVFVAVMVFGGIVFGLYIIDPPEYVNQLARKTAENVVDSTVGGDISTQQLMADSMRDDIEKSDKLSEQEKEEMSRKLDDIEQSLGDMQETLKAVA